MSSEKMRLSAQTLKILSFWCVFNKGTDKRLGISTTKLGFNFIPERNKKANDLTNDFKEKTGVFEEKQETIDRGYSGGEGLKGYNSTYINPEGEQSSGKEATIVSSEVQSEVKHPFDDTGKGLESHLDPTKNQEAAKLRGYNPSSNTEQVFDSKDVPGRFEAQRVKGEAKEYDAPKGIQSFKDKLPPKEAQGNNTESNSLADLIMGGNVEEENKFKLNLFPGSSDKEGKYNPTAEDFIIELERVDIFNDMIDQFDNLKGEKEEGDDLLDMMDIA